MGSKAVRNVFLVVVVALATGCDPETTVRQKVPGWLQSLMGAKPPKAGAVGSKEKKATVELKILSPKNDETFPVGSRIVFSGEGTLDSGKKAGSKDLVWKVKNEKIGNGPRMTKEYPVGKYQAELTMVLPGRKTISRKVRFSVASMLTGSVIFNGQGLSGTQVVLESADTMEVEAKATTKQDGTFGVEIPDKGSFRLVPRKEGFSFSPPSLDLRRVDRSKAVKFTAAKGGITDIKLTASEDSDTPIDNLCPEQTAYLKASIASETPLVRLEVVLIPSAISSTNPVVLGEAIDASEIPNSSDPKAPKSMKVRVTEYLLKEEEIRHPFRLQLTAYDEKGNAFSAVADDSITIDMFRCYDKWLADASAEHAQGDTEKAVETYAMLEKYKRLVPDITRVSDQFARLFFNKGLAYAELAVSGKKGDYKRESNLGKAAHSFGRMLEYRSSDPETMLLAGWVSYLKEDYQRAVEYLSGAIKLVPKSAKAYQIRADAYVKTRRYGNMAKAVDDYTRALRFDPDLTDARKSRREALKLGVKYDGKPEDERVDISALKFPDVEKKFKLKGYIRK